ncbi:hypothetical protein N7445_010423 [Penicillium cf. griseofulvum]|nr:hypothetical protein N7445_010423 [Penicillium cf. griseofulvum]
MDLVDTGRPPAEKRVRASMKKLVGRGSHLASFSRNPAYPAPSSALRETSPAHHAKERFVFKRIR